MAIAPIEIQLQYADGLVPNPYRVIDRNPQFADETITPFIEDPTISYGAPEDVWHNIESWDNLTWIDSEDLTENTLRFEMLTPDGQEELFEGITSIRLIINQEGEEIIHEKFQVKGKRLDEIIHPETGQINTFGNITCSSTIGQDAAIDFLRQTFPAQVYDYNKPVNPEPYQELLLDTEDTIGSIRRQPISEGSNHAHDIAFILAHGLPRLFAYDEEGDTDEDIPINEDSEIKLNKNENAGHLVASLIGDILWEHNDWEAIKKLLDTFGFGVHFYDLSEAQLEERFGYQVFDSADFIANNPELTRRLNRQDAQVGDLKYLTPDDVERFAKQPVPFLINPYTYTTLEETSLPVLDYLQRSKDTPDVTQLYNAGRTSGDSPQKFWETFIGSTRIEGQNLEGSDVPFVYEARVWHEGYPDPDTVPPHVSNELKPFLIGYNPDHKDGRAQPVTALMRELGFYTFERRIDGVTRSPYVPAVFPNLPAREIAITVARARRRVRSNSYTYRLEPVVSHRAGNRYRIDRLPEQGSVIRFSKVTHTYNADRSSTMVAEAYRLNS